MAGNSEEHGPECTGDVKPLLTPADVNSQTPVAGCETTRKSVDRRAPVNSPRRGSSGRERSTYPSPAKIRQSTTAQQDSCYPAASNTSTPKSAAKCMKTSGCPLDTAGHGLPLPMNRRRSLRCLKVDQSEEQADESHKLTSSSPKHDRAKSVSPVRPSPRSKSAKSPQATFVHDADDSSLSRSLRTSPRRITSPGGNDAGSDLISRGQDKTAAGTDHDPLHVSRNVSPQRTVSSKNAAAADPVDSREVTKSVDAEGSPLRKSGDDGEKPVNGLSKQLPAVPDKVALLFGTTKADKKKTLVRNRRKSSYCDRPEEKWSRGRLRSLEPELRQKSPRVGRPRRKSDSVGIHAEVPSGSAQNQPTPEDSGRQLRRRRKHSIDNQCQPTHGDKDLKSTKQKDNPDLSHCGKVLAIKREQEDGDASSLTGLDDSFAGAASSDDVRTTQPLQFPCLFIPGVA